MHYHRPQDINELQKLLQNANREYTILAGGTDLLVEMRQTPLPDDAHILDISGVTEINSIKEENDQLVLGALVTHQQLAESVAIQKFAPLLAAACCQVGSLQIRNRGTIGGNITNASPCADTVPPLIVLNAEVEILGPQGTRTTAIEEFFDKPYFPRIQKNEVVTRIRFSKLLPRQKSAFFKLGRRKALAISRINMAAVLQVDENNIITEVRLAPGSVFPAWRRVSEVEQFLIGKAAERNNFEEAGKITSEKMIKISGRRWSTPYKEPVTAALVRRTLMLALEQNG